MSLLYLDYNCFQRRFDDTRQERIRREASACDAILDRAAAGKVELVWSFMHEDENSFCPFPGRRAEIIRLGRIFTSRVVPLESIPGTGA